MTKNKIEKAGHHVANRGTPRWQLCTQVSVDTTLDHVGATNAAVDRQSPSFSIEPKEVIEHNAGHIRHITVSHQFEDILRNLPCCSVEERKAGLCILQWAVQHENAMDKWVELFWRWD